MASRPQTCRPAREGKVGGAIGGGTGFVPLRPSAVCFSSPDHLGMALTPPGRRHERGCGCMIVQSHDKRSSVFCVWHPTGSVFLVKTVMWGINRR